jgi:hypothetical protein
MTEATLTPTQKDAVEKVKALQRLTTATGFISKRSVGEILGKLNADDLAAVAAVLYAK